MIRLLFVDDHPIVSAGLVARFRETKDFSVVSAVATMNDAIVEATRGTVDLALVDVQLETLTTPVQVTQLSQHCHVVLFSSRRLDEYVRSLLDAGAACFLDKATPLDELDAAIRRIHEGHEQPRVVQLDGVRAKLSAREYEVYRALAVCQAPKEIAAKLGLSASTVYCHLENARKKLGVNSLQELIAHTFSHRDS